VPSTSQTASLAGTYETQYGYDPDTGNLSSYYDTAAAGLPAETVNLGYDTQNDQVSVTSTIGDYVTSLSYTPLSQPQEYALGTTNDPVQIDDSHDQQTGRLTGQDTVTGTSETTVDDTQDNYNNVGNVTSEADTPSGGPAQVQCFQYQDYLGRLTQAWSQASNDCSSGPSQSAESGAAAPYWETYSYNAQNDLTGETSTPASGAATTMTNGYPSAGSAQGSFISPDAIINPDDPQDLNAYAYASDTPSTLEDPSGNMFLAPGGPPRTCIGSSACDGRLEGHGNGGNGGYGGDDSSSGGYNGPFPGFGGFPSPASPSYVRSVERSHTVVPAIVLMPGPKPARKVLTNGSSGDNACTVSDLRFGLGPNCSAATPHSGGNGGLGRLRHNLSHYYDVATTATNTVANKAGDHLFISESFCLVGCVSVNMQGNTIYVEANAWSWNILSKRRRNFWGSPPDSIPLPRRKRYETILMPRRAWRQMRAHALVLPQTRRAEVWGP
jgi:hypothetical protein